MAEIVNNRPPVEQLLVERIRPKSLNFTCMLGRVRKIVSNVKDPKTKALKSNVLLYSPSPGTGKTTITRILSSGCKTLELNASKDRGIDVVRNDIVSFIHSHSIDVELPKVVVLEEMDGMTDQAFDSLRAIIEGSGNVRFIGNCNDISKIPDPIRSRFTCIGMAPVDQVETKELLDIYKVYIKSLLNKKNIAYNSDEELEKFILAEFPNMRNIVNNVDVMINSNMTNLSEFVCQKSYSCEDLFDSIFEVSANETYDTYKSELYTKVITDYSYNADDIIKAFSDQFIDYILEKHKEQIKNIDVFVITIADYLDQLTRTTNPKVVLMALVFSIYQIVNVK